MLGSIKVTVKTLDNIDDKGDNDNRRTRFLYNFFYSLPNEIDPLTIDIQDHKQDQTFEFDIKFNNAEIDDYYSDSRSLEIYKRFINQQAIFISQLSLYDYCIVLSHLSPFYSVSTEYIQSQGDVSGMTIKVLPCLIPLIYKVLKNKITFKQIKSCIDERLDLMLFKFIPNINKLEVLSLIKKIMEQYYVDFQRVFQESPALDDDIVVYRAVQDVYWNNSLSDNQFIALTAQSTSLFSNHESNFHNRKGIVFLAALWDHCCLKRILLKKGCHALFIEFFDTLRYNFFEVILPPNTVYEIQKTHDKLFIDSNQKEYIKVFDMIATQTPGYPSVEEITKEFISFFKDWMYNKDSFWVVTGGYGLESIFTHKYNMDINNNQIDLSILFTYYNNDKEIEDYKDKLVKHFKDFAESTPFAYLFSLTARKSDWMDNYYDKDLKWIVNVSYAGRRWIYISLLSSQIKEVEIDNDVSKAVGLPIKSMKSYAKDYIHLLAESRVYEKTGKLNVKGLQDIERTQQMCKWTEEISREYPTFCDYLNEHSINDLAVLSKKDIEELLHRDDNKKRKIS